MKKSLLFSLLFINAHCMYAQYVPAVVSDVPYNSIAWPKSGTNPNTASADYTFQTTSPWGGPYILKVCAADYNVQSYSGTVYVDDNRPGHYYSNTIDSNTGLTLYPDVTICDNLSWYTSLFTNSFWLPVVYNRGGTIYLQLPITFDVGSSSIGSGNITFPTPIQVSNPGAAIGPPHIDVESQYSIRTPWGSPKSDKVTITWAEPSGIRAWTGSINALVSLWPSMPSSLSSIGTYNTIYSSPIAKTPDVAMVERQIGSGLVYHDIAIFTFLENTAPGTLWYAEWDITAGTVATNILDKGSFDAPRIDAIDNFLYNDPAIPWAYYTVVTTGTPSTAPTRSVWAYTNINPRIIHTDVLSAVGLSRVETPYNATVACGPTSCSGSIASLVYNYTVQYYGTGLYNTYLAEQIDWTSGRVSGTRYYEVPQGSVTGTTNAICSSNNNDGTIAGPQYLFSAWDDGTSSILTKMNQMCPAFSFKPSGNTTDDVHQNTWNIAPNPTTGMTVLTASQDAGANEQRQYIITDMAGREISRAGITGQSQLININQYAPGLYLLHIYNSGKEEKTIKIIKE